MSLAFITICQCNRASHIVKFFNQTEEDDAPIEQLQQRFGEIQFFAAVYIDCVDEPFLVACIEEYKDVLEHTAENDFYTEWTCKSVAGRRPLQWVIYGD